MISTGGGILGCSLEKAYIRSHLHGRTWRRRKKNLRSPGVEIYPSTDGSQRIYSKWNFVPIFWQERTPAASEIELVDPADYNLNEPEYKTPLSTHHHAEYNQKA